MKKTKVIKKGFSLIEILLALGMILFLTVAAFLIYNRVDTASYAKKINDDIRYSYSFYKNITEGKSPKDNFSTKSGCCDLSSTIDSNFIEIKEKDIWGKHYSSPKKDEIIINSSSAWNNNGSAIIFDAFSYEINGNISPELCNSIVSTNIKNVELIYIATKTSSFRLASKPSDKYKFSSIVNSVSDIPTYCQYGAKKITFTFDG